MKNTKPTAEQWVRARFPNAKARIAADDAVDKLDNEETMQRHMQVWVDVYASVAVPR